MRFALSFLLVVFAAASMPAAAQETGAPIAIEPGETVTVRIVGDPAAFELVSRDPALVRLSPDPESPAENTVRFTFVEVEGQGLILKVHSGYDRHFNYRAHMFRGEQSASTSVCTVMPRIPGFEMWPHPIDRLELSEPRFVEVSAGQISCQ